jgi:uncharacterized membrane protein YhaH (DUF805 family)
MPHTVRRTGDIHTCPCPSPGVARAKDDRRNDPTATLTRTRSIRTHLEELMTTPATTDVPLSQPLYGASFGQSISRFFTKYATFTGRASRSEFWWWFLVNAIVGIIIYGITYGIGISGAVVDDQGVLVLGPAYWIGLVLAIAWGLGTIVPWLALCWRRLHDTNRPGPFYFLGLIPFVGGIILIIFLALPPDPAGARFDE